MGIEPWKRQGALRVVLRCPYTSWIFRIPFSHVRDIKTVLCPCCRIRWGLPSKEEIGWASVKVD